MNEYDSKRSGGSLGVPTSVSSLTVHEPNHDSKGVQYCNRSGCSTRLNSVKGSHNGSPEKTKFTKVSFRAKNIKSDAGNSSKTLSSPTNSRKSHQEKPVRTPLRGPAESSSKQNVPKEFKSSRRQPDSEDSEVIPITTTIQTVLTESEGSESLDLQSTIQNNARTSRPQKQNPGLLGSSSCDTPSSSSSSTSSPIRCYVASRRTAQVTKPCSQYLGSGPPRYHLKKLSCSSVSDVLSSGHSSNINNSRKLTSVRKRPSDGESSSSSYGGRSTSGSSISSISASSGSLMPQRYFRPAKSLPTSRDGPVSFRTRRVPIGENRMKLPEQQSHGSVSISVPNSQLSVVESVPENSSRSFPTEAPPIVHNSFHGQPSSSVRGAGNRLLSNNPANSSRHGPMGERDGYRRFNMEGIAEVLLALERIEQDNEITYEQLMVLETNLFLRGFSFQDQHRDMRLDIDNMTYEELLSLEDKMGTVSTALSEELLSKCLKRSIYMPCSCLPGITSCGDDDNKCCVCQEEYVAGEEVGKLACDHRYHVDCISQWLRHKNWCPICKVYAASPSNEKNN